MVVIRNTETLHGLKGTGSKEKTFLLLTRVERQHFLPYPCDGVSDPRTALSRVVCPRLTGTCEDLLITVV